MISAFWDSALQARQLGLAWLLRGAGRLAVTKSREPAGPVSTTKPTALEGESDKTHPARHIRLDEVAAWPGVSTEPSRRGATAIVFDGHERGHVHSDRPLDLPLPEDRRKEVLDARRAKKWFSGRASKPLANDTDAQDGIALLRETYDGLRAR